MCGLRAIRTYSQLRKRSLRIELHQEILPLPLPGIRLRTDGVRAGAASSTEPSAAPIKPIHHAASSGGGAGAQSRSAIFPRELALDERAGGAGWCTAKSKSFRIRQ